jgi:hypothetical protein
MSVGIGIIGRDVTFTLGGSALVGVTQKGTTWTNELGDTTDDQSSGYTEFMATPLLKSGEFSISGTFKNLEVVKSYFGTSVIFPVVETFPDGSTLAYDAAMTTVSYSSGSNETMTFEAAFSTSGVPTFTAGT